MKKEYGLLWSVLEIKVLKTKLGLVPTHNCLFGRDPWPPTAMGGMQKKHFKLALKLWHGCPQKC
jgi:hypothetical protein